jgi:hypothetical protein
VIRKITVLGILMGVVFSSFGQLEELWKRNEWYYQATNGSGETRLIDESGDSLYFMNSDFEILKTVNYNFFEFDSVCDFESHYINDMESELFGGDLSFSSHFFNLDDKIEFIITSACGDSNYSKLQMYYAVMNEDAEIIHSDTIARSSSNQNDLNFGFYEDMFLVTYWEEDSDADFNQAFKCPGKLMSLNQNGIVHAAAVEDTLNVDLVTSVGEVSQNELRVWNDNNTIHYQVDEVGDFQVLIFNTNAQLQHQEDNFTGTDGSFNASGLAAGLYFITINDNNEVLKSETKKIVIR